MYDTGCIVNLPRYYLKMSVEDNESVDVIFSNIRSDLMNLEELNRMERPSRIFSSRHHSYPVGSPIGDHTSTEPNELFRYRSREPIRSLGSPIRQTQLEGSTDFRYFSEYERRLRYPWRYTERSYNSSPTATNMANGESGRNRSPYVRFTITDPETQRVTAAGQIPLNSSPNPQTSRTEIPDIQSSHVEVENMLPYTNNLTNDSVNNSNSPLQFTTPRCPSSGRRFRRYIPHPYSIRNYLDSPIRPLNRRVRFSSTNQNFSDIERSPTPEQELPTVQNDEIERDNSFEEVYHGHDSISSLSSDMETSTERRLSDFVVSENNESNGDVENRSNLDEESNLSRRITRVLDYSTPTVSFGLPRESSTPPSSSRINNSIPRSLSYIDNDEDDDRNSLTIELELSPVHSNNDGPPQTLRQSYDATDLNEVNSPSGTNLLNSNSTRSSRSPENGSDECRATEELVPSVQVEEHPQTYQELNEQLVRLFECPVCFEHIIPPVYQCCMGHIICRSCKHMCDICPTCRNPFNTKRNLCMEKVGYLLKFPCKNSLTGCKEQLFIGQKDQHELECGYRHYPCIFNNCSWKGYYPEFHVHMTQHHNSHILTGEEQVLDIIINNNQTTKWFLSAHQEHFVVVVNISGPPKRIKAQVNYIGQLSKAKKFNFSIVLSKKQEDETVSQKLTYTSPTFPYSEIKEILNNSHQNKDIFCLPSEVIEPYINKRNHRLPITLKIDPVNTL
ncbi:uncharacterized protein LOC126896188 isoform X2 [Daktulosphaira vitifoliae]|uniref:uncharacterized protein LOC126896188 isoform X2 n=1 Tax=Daktulosphaira vitifoliae TaxID=58002 RepID=UPI0021AAAF05|nr:uncharacterized protein LOC126896188 isoform X2 [Daktulosphaira vitifoliae]